MTPEIAEQFKKLRTAFRVCEGDLQAYEADRRKYEEVFKLINILHQVEGTIDNAVSALVDEHAMHPDIKKLRYGSF